MSVSDKSVIKPGSTIGILGGGQLGRMIALAAAQLGYRSHIYAPEASGPATEVSAEWTQGGFDRTGKLLRFADAVDIATYEFENVDPAWVEKLTAHVAVHPPVAALSASRYRPAEKALAVELGGRTAPYREVSTLAELDAGIAEIGCPAILKTTSMGYDGKGQARIDAPGDTGAAWQAIGSPCALKHGVPAIVERRVTFFAEFSVILCRGADGAVAVWDTPENVHKDGILDRSVVPASPRVLEQAAEAVALAKAIAARLGHVGVLTCEFFATDDGPLFNEMAPRVHNSGHWTIEGAVTSQFENHVRAVCGLPLGDTARTAPRVEMTNLIGHDADAWLDFLAEPGAHLHLYGKHDARPGRKMGHVTRLHDSVEDGVLGGAAA